MQRAAISGASSDRTLLETPGDRLVISFEIVGPANDCAGCSESAPVGRDWFVSRCVEGGGVGGGIGLRRGRDFPLDISAPSTHHK